MSEQPQKKELTTTQALFTIAIFAGMAWFFFGGGVEKLANQNLQQISNQVASDSVKQYNITKRNGSAMDRCVQAGLVVASYLQAQNEDAYREWKKVEELECRLAGITK